MSVANFKDIFKGLDRARGVTYVDKKGEDGQKIKGKSFVTREKVLMIYGISTSRELNQV